VRNAATMPMAPPLGLRSQAPAKVGTQAAPSSQPVWQLTLKTTGSLSPLVRASG
jgi:hypothetical protein